MSALRNILNTENNLLKRLHMLLRYNMKYEAPHIATEVFFKHVVFIIVINTLGA